MTMVREEGFIAKSNKIQYNKYMIEKGSIHWESKSERRFVRKVDSFVQQRERLLDTRQFSLEPLMGRLAIHVSTAADLRSHNSPDEQKRIFQEEGEYLKEWYEQQGLYDEVKLITHTNRMELGMDIADKDVAGLVTIGHGSLGDFWLPNGEGHFDWEDVARNSKRHLKLGNIHQRTCGNVYKKSLPWGTFAAADQTRITAATGEAIPEEHPPAKFFSPIFTTPHNDREQLLAKVHAYLDDGSQ